MKKIAIVLMLMSVVSAQGYDKARVQEIQRKYPRFRDQVQKLVGEITNYENLLSYEFKRLGGRKPTENTMEFISETTDQLYLKEAQLKDLLERLELTGDWKVVN